MFIFTSPPVTLLGTSAKVRAFSTWMVLSNHANGKSYSTVLADVATVVMVTIKVAPAARCFNFINEMCASQSLGFLLHQP
jgi:hypothetical protein